MAEYSVRHETETTERTVFELPSTTNWVEVQKVLTACRHLTGAGAYDDTVAVTADEESIKFTIVHSVETAPRSTPPA